MSPTLLELGPVFPNTLREFQSRDLTSVHLNRLTNPLD